LAAWLSISRFRDWFMRQLTIDLIEHDYSVTRGQRSQMAPGIGRVLDPEGQRYGRLLI